MYDRALLNGAALRAVDTAPRDTSLYELARAHACTRAAKRRVAGSVAVGAILVMVGLLGMRGAIPPKRRVKSKDNAGLPPSG